MIDRRRPDVTELELVGGRENRSLRLAEYDPAWADSYGAHERRIRTALGAVARQVEHIGSTSVPGLAGKPIVDIVVAVDDITAEEDYLDPLLATGYVLRVREPGHRMVRTLERDVHIHLLEAGDAAIDAHLLFRDLLRRDASARELYESTKRDLIARDWADMNEYADAKTRIIEELLQRARGSGAASSWTGGDCRESPVSLRGGWPGAGWQG